MPSIIPKNDTMLPVARELRRNMTSQERKLWYLFLRKYPVKIYKQRIIGSFIVDFYCAPARLVIEADGAPHFTGQGMTRDRERDAILESLGLQVLHFTDHQIDTEFEAVCTAIDAAITARKQ